MDAKGGVVTAPGQQARRQLPEQNVLIAWKPGEELDVRAWVRIGHRFGGMARCSPWLLGDWIRYGNTRWGEKYREARRITGYDVQSLRNFAPEVSSRRRSKPWRNSVALTPSRLASSHTHSAMRGETSATLRSSRSASIGTWPWAM